MVVDNNGSAAQILPVDDLQKKFESFGWEAYTIDGHDPKQIEGAFKKIKFEHNTKPKVIVANTVKGKGVSFMEPHGPWHARIPNKEEFAAAMKELE